MEFNAEFSGLSTSLVDGNKQKDKKMFDMSVLKKGLNYHGTTKDDLDNEKQEIKKEEERLEREKAVMNKTSKSYNTNKDDSKSQKTKANDAQSEKKEEHDEEREGILKMVQVQNMPDDIDMIVSQMKTLDFSK